MTERWYMAIDERSETQLFLSHIDSTDQPQQYIINMIDMHIIPHVRTKVHRPIVNNNTVSESYIPLCYIYTGFLHNNHTTVPTGTIVLNTIVSDSAAPDKAPAISWSTTPPRYRSNDYHTLVNSSRVRGVLESYIEISWIIRFRIGSVVVAPTITE